MVVAHPGHILRRDGRLRAACHTGPGARLMTLAVTIQRIPVTGYQAAALAVILWLLS